ncbi:MAG: hypothetical protein KGL39_28150 [Patescibacteria group bacterium]|nr:hypothetical protein [Patescibacteria group bacterium]
MPQLQSQDGINDVRTAAHLTIGQRLQNLDLTKLFIWANPSPAVLPFLAWQFDVAGPYWTLLGGTSNIDNLVKNAIALHKISGTPQAIINLVNNSGLTLNEILEGQDSWGGNSWPSNEGWAAYRVLVNLAYPFTPASQALLFNAIKYFAPARCWLDQLIFIPADIEDTMPMPTDQITLVAGNFIIDQMPTLTDYIIAPAWPIADTKTVAPTYNGHFLHAGLSYTPAGQGPVIDSGLTLGGNPIEGSP